jgi:hypothetical protein
MTAMVVNVLVGLVTSLVTAAAVWLWQRARGSRVLRRKAALLGVTSGTPVVVAATSTWGDAGTTRLPDLQAVVRLAMAVTELGNQVAVRPAAEVRGVNREHVELCVGGPTANPRTAAHVASYLPGVTFTPFDAGDPGSLAIVVGGREFARERGVREHAIVARFVPAGTRHAVLVIAGQTAVTNQAAAELLCGQHRTLPRALGQAERFCLVLAVHHPDVYGPEAVEVVLDASDLAFAATPAQGHGGVRLGPGSGP